MRSEKITKCRLTLKLIKNLCKKLTFQIMYVASILSLNHACAPQTWLNEAQTYSHLGDWEQALNRYEDSLINGAHYRKSPTSNIQQIIQGSELSIETLFKQRQESFISSLNAPNKVPACLKLARLTQLYPLAPELDIFQQSLAQHSSDFVHFDSRLKSAFKMIDQAETDLTSQTLMQALLVDHEKLMYHLMEQEAFYDQCPWVESDWYQTYYNYRKLHTQLNDLIHLVSRSKSANKVTENIKLKSIKRLSYLTQVFLKEERSFAILFKNEAEALQENLSDAYTSFWRNYSFQEQKQENWGSAWWFKQFSLLPSSLFEAQISASINEWPVHDKLEEQFQLLAASDYLLKNKKQSHKHLDAEQEIHTSYMALYRAKPIYLSIKEGDAHCNVSTQKQSHEQRDVAETKQVTAPQYLAALKRVETLQGQLESALSQRESLEKSILSAQSDLDAIDRIQLKKQSQTYHRLVKQKDQISKELEKKRILFKQQHTLLSPPGPKDLEFLDLLNADIDLLDSKIEETEMNVEIAKSAWEDSKEQLLQSRREVNRLAGYLTKTVIEVEKASAELDQKEVDLALIPKTKNEKVYSVFRYPLNEHKLSCRVTWSVFPEGNEPKTDQIGPPQVLWHAEEELSELAISHKAYRRYGIKALRFSKKKLKSRLIKRLKRQMYNRFGNWLSHERQEQLVLRGQKLVRKYKNDTKLELLAFLSFVSPTSFLDQFYKRLSIELNDPVPFLIQ